MTNGTSVSVAGALFQDYEIGLSATRGWEPLVVTLKKESSLTKTTYFVESELIKNANRDNSATNQYLAI